MCNILNLFNTTELYTLKLVKMVKCCYINFTTIKKTATEMGSKCEPNDRRFSRENVVN